MPFSPTLHGSIVVDNSLSGIAALFDFSLTTGSMTWTESDFVGSFVDDIFFDALGELTGFSLDRFEDGLGGFMYIYSANTMAIGDPDGQLNACNSCVSFSRSVSVPEPGTLALLGIGLLGMGLVRRRRTV